MDLKITEMYAFIATEKDGQEGIMAFYDASTGMMLPMVGADVARVKSLLMMAETISRASGATYRICKFTNRQDITDQVKD